MSNRAARAPKLNDHAIAILSVVVDSSDPPRADNFIRAHAYRLAELGLINIVDGRAFPTVAGIGVAAELVSVPVARPSAIADADPLERMKRPGGLA